MQDVQAHLEALLKQSSQYQLTEDDRRVIKTMGLEKFLFAKLTSKKFRKWKMDQTVIDRVRFSIKDAIDHDQPIPVYFFQGGYKLWRFPSSPNPDWAEFFNLAYVISYVAPIAAAYKQGVSLTYYCHTLLMEKHDNLTTAEIQSYIDGLQYLMNEFSHFFPSNLSIRILRDADIYSREEYSMALEGGLEKAREDFKTWPDARIKDYQRMAELNIKWNGAEDWTKLSSTERQEKIVLAALYEQAATSNLPKVMTSVKAPNLILLFTKAAPIFIGIGSTKTSIAKHWVGFGVLEKDEKGFYERILTPSQYEALKNQPHDTIPVKLLKGVNYTDILVYPRLNLGR